MGLRKLFIRGAAWNIIEKSGVYGMQLVFGILLARLLSPRDFGLIGIVMVFFSIASVFLESGLAKAYVQKKSVTDIDANTIFFTNLIMGILLYVLLWSISSKISRYYSYSELELLIKVMGVILIINSFKVIQLGKLARMVDFRKKAGVNLVASFAAGITACAAALNGAGVWSLVILQLGTHFITIIGLWIVSKWRPSLVFSFGSLRTIFSFGGWILLSSLLRRVFDSVYRLAIGKVFSISDLGFYSKSSEIKQTFVNRISGSVLEVFFPVFSKIQDDKRLVRKAMKEYIQHITFFVTPVLIYVIVSARPLVLLVLTEKWEPMIPFLQLFCVLGLLTPLNQANRQLYYTQGKSRWGFYISVVNNTLRAANLIIMYRFGISYIILGEIIISAIALILNSGCTYRVIKYPLIKQLADIKFIIAGGVFIFIAGISINMIFKNYLSQLIINTLCLIILYVFFQYIFNKKVLKKLISTTKMLFI